MLRESKPRGSLLSLRRVRLFSRNEVSTNHPKLYNAFLNIAVNQQLDLLVIIGGSRPVAAQRKWKTIETGPRERGRSGLSRGRCSEACRDGQSHEAGSTMGRELHSERNW